MGYQVHGSIVDSYSTGSASSSCLGSSSRSYAGGLVGYQAGESITGSYSTGAVSSASDYHSFAGGLVGEQFGSSILLHNCYSTGSVTCSSTNASSYSVAGELVGDQSSGIINICYSTGIVQTSGLAKPLVGGLVGSGGTVINSFWDIETSGLESSAGGVGRTTAQMKQSTNYIAWNTPSQTYWTINDGVDYPRLNWENQPGTFLAAQVFGDFVLGAGITSDPYRISTPQQLNTIGLFADQWDKVFRLENDIDLSAFSGTEYNRIGVGYGKYFNGTFDGRGYVISNLIYRNTSAIYGVGLFGFTSNAEIRNIDITNIDILTGGSNVGGLVGYQSGGSITNCAVTGMVVCSSVIDSHVGGLVGELDGGGAATWCVSGVSVSCISSGSSSYAGGVVGYQYSGTLTNCISMGEVNSSASDSCAGGLVGNSSGPINNCCSIGEVNSSSSSWSRAGGLVGTKSSGTLTNCYSTGAVTSSSPSSNAYAGGLIGYLYADSATVNKCYSAGHVGATGKFVYQGGLLGYRLGSGTVTACFWDKDTSGQTSGVGSGSSTGITGKTTAQMQTLSTFTSAWWDFTNETANGTNNYWRMCVDGVDYSRLNWESVGDFTCPDGVAIEDLDYFVGRWLLNNCTSTNNYCGGADVNSSSKVDLMDFVVLAEHWLEGI